MADVPDPAGEFYVGYLPAPRRALRAVRLATVAFAIFACAVAAVLPGVHRDPGDAVWEGGRARVFEGVLTATPYAMLHLTRPADDIPASTTLLVVEMGKFGAGRRAARADGRHVTLQGFLLRRDGRQMIELEPGDGAIRVGDVAGDVPREAVVGRVELHGEMVDSKCWLGAMKPGDGRVHRECAMRCISGGIPPMLVGVSPDGTRTYTLIAFPEGAVPGDDVLQLVGLPIRVRGELRRIGTQNVLYAEASGFSTSIAPGARAGPIVASASRQP